MKTSKLLFVVPVFLILIRTAPAFAYSKECQSAIEQYFSNQFKEKVSEVLLERIESTFYLKDNPFKNAPNALNDFCRVYDLEGAAEVFFPRLRWLEATKNHDLPEQVINTTQVEKYLSEVEKNGKTLSLLFTPRISNWHFAPQTEGQREYERLTLNTIRHTYLGIVSYKWNIFDVLYFLGKQRYQSARSVQSILTGFSPDLPLPEAERFIYGFGALRVDAARTPISSEGPYSSLESPIRNLFKEKIGALGEEYREIGFSYKDQLITSFSCNSRYCDILHTDPKIAFSLLKTEAAPLFDRIRNSSYDQDATQLLKDLGHLHWLLAHLMPFYRGSASITENLIRSLLLVHHQSLVPYQVGKLPDLEALIEESYEQFSTKYGKLILDGIPFDLRNLPSAPN